MLPIDKEVLYLFEHTPLSQDNIAKITELSPSYVSRLVRKNIPPLTVAAKNASVRSNAQLYNKAAAAYQGEIPEGYRVSFKDWNTHNLSPENLELITDREYWEIRRWIDARFTGAIRHAYASGVDMAKLSYYPVYNFTGGGKSIISYMHTGDEPAYVQTEAKVRDYNREQNKYND
jgi:HNH endonuclease